MAIDPRLKEVYTDAAGRTWYEFHNDGMMDYKRFMSAQLAERFLRHGLTQSFMEKLVETGVTIAHDKKRTEQQVRQDQAALWQNLHMRLGYVSSEDQYLRLAAVYFVLPDEPLDQCHESWTQKKIVMWEQDQAAKDFFLQRAITRTHDLPDISIPDMQQLLTIAQERSANIPTLPQS